jgi:hypothetical protein
VTSGDVVCVIAARGGANAAAVGEHRRSNALLVDTGLDAGAAVVATTDALGRGDTPGRADSDVSREVGIHGVLFEDSAPAVAAIDARRRA